MDRGQYDFDPKITPHSVPQEVAKKLKEAIFGGYFGPGDRLIEADLCQQFGVSRPSIREALRILQAEHLIEIVPNRGPQVTVLTFDAARQIYQVRALLEGKAAELCALHATAEDHNAMAAALDEFKRAVEVDDSQERVAATSRFYAILLARSENSIIQEIVNGLIARINFLRLRSMRTRGRAKRSLDEMTAIFNAIRARDPDGARRTAEYHVEQAREAIESQEREAKRRLRRDKAVRQKSGDGRR